MRPILKLKSRHVFELLAIFSVLLFSTPLIASSGYVILFGFSIFLLSNNYKFSKTKSILLFLLPVFFTIYFFLMIPQFSDPNMICFRNNSIVMFFMAFTILLDDHNDCCDIDRKLNIIDFLYYIFFSFILIILLRFAFLYKNNWAYRMNNRSFFPFGYHHVDFSVVVILCFILGVRRAKYFSCLLLVLVSWLILPARTSRLFFLLFFMFSFLFKIKELKNCIKFFFPNKFIGFSILLLLATTIFALFFVSILPIFLQVGTSHESLYDQSNKDRFTAFLYALQVIWHKKLIFKGLLPNNSYQTIILSSPYNINVFPHNSYLSMIMYYSIAYGGLYFFIITQWGKKYYNTSIGEGVILLSYFITATILHDMFIAQRFFAFYVFMSLPKYKNNIHLFKYIIWNRSETK